jgi:hypothetical protein
MMAARTRMLPDEHCQSTIKPVAVRCFGQLGCRRWWKAKSVAPYKRKGVAILHERRLFL